MIFDASKAIQGTTESKKLWHEANAKGDEQGKKKAHEAANMYRKLLADNGYGDIAKSLAEVDVAGAEAILKSFKDTSTINSKIDTTFDSQVTNMNDMKKKYNYLEDYNYNHNHYESDIGKSIMENYKFQGKTASDNEVASGGASNGGNIDSYAAANANRQQLAFTNAGNQAVLNDFNTRINNARGILNDLGGYLQNQEKGMQTTIGIQQSEEQRQFENEETKKNNQVDRDVKTSEVTGTVPTSMSLRDNPYLNDDGTVKNVHTTDFSLIIHNAEEALKTEKDPDKIKDLKQTIEWATQARLIKTDMDEYSRWRNTTTAVAPKQTESGRQFDKNAELTEKEINTTADLTREEIQANERMNNATNTTNQMIAQWEALAKEAQNAETFDDFSSKLKLSNDYGAMQFLYDVVEPYWNMSQSEKIKIVDDPSSVNKDKDGNVVSYGADGNEFPLKTLLEANKNSITKDGASKILLAFKEYDEEWVKKIEWKTTESEPKYDPTAQ